MIIADQDNVDLMSLFEGYLPAEKSSIRQQVKYRIQAEELVGPEENLYRIDYLFRDQAMMIQLLSRDGPSIEEDLSVEERWSNYIDLFTRMEPTEGVKLSNNRVFLDRNLPPENQMDDPIPAMASSELEIKICVNTYKMFFVDNTEDFFMRAGRQQRTQLAHRDVFKASDDTFAKCQQDHNTVRNALWHRWIERNTN